MTHRSTTRPARFRHLMAGAAVLALFVAACGDDDDDDAETATATADTTRDARPPTTQP